MNATAYRSALARPESGRGLHLSTRRLGRRVGAIVATFAVLLLSAGIAASPPAGADDYASYPSKPASGRCELSLAPLETRCSIDALLDASSPLTFTVNGNVLTSTTVGGKVRLRTLPATCAPVTASYVVNGVVLTETYPVAIPAILPSPCTGGPIPTVTVVATPVPYVTATPTPTPKAGVTATPTPTTDAKATATPTTKAKATATPTSKQGNRLAYTGSDNGPLVFAGMALIAAGGVALTVRRMTQRGDEG